MERIELARIERRKNKKGQKYYAISYGGVVEIFDTLEEALMQVGKIARFMNALPNK